MNACKNAQHSTGAATLLKHMASRKIKPNNIIYTSAMMSYIGASLAKVKDLAQEREGQGLDPDPYFIEAHAVAALGRKLSTGADISETISVISGIEESRLKESAAIIASARRKTVRLTRLMKCLHDALAHLV